jgi:predicted nucleic acid-binding protein
VRVYLDNCCLNRPFDDQRQTRVRLEAEAKLCIQEHIREGTLELAWSYILDFENTANPFEERRTTISRWRQYATIDVEETAAILQEANALVELGLKAKDALHIACAIAGECTYFLTTDDEILRRGKDVRGITVLDPTAFVREMNL